jgi:hypothetical protein
MLDMDLGSGECGGYAIVALRAERLVRRVIAIIWESDGFAAQARVAEPAASAGACRQAIVPIRRQPTRMR